MGIRKEFQQLIDELESTPAIVIEKAKVSDGPTDSQIKDIVLGDAKFELSKAVDDLYAAFSSVKIFWACDLNQHPQILKYDQDDEQIYGEIRILPIEEMAFLDSNLESDHWAGNFDEDELQDLKNFRSIDIHDDYIRVGFLIENGKFTEYMYFIQQSATGFSAFPLSFEEYLQAMIEAKGFFRMAL